MCEMRRRFLPVGQGAFYVEQFFDYGTVRDRRVNVVYDCGSLSGSTLLHDRIDDCFYAGEKIHALFLSHFDADHVNGLEYLLKHYQVEHIFFPLLTKEDKALIRLQYLINNTLSDNYSFWLRFALEPLETIEQMGLDYAPMLHPVESETENNGSIESRDTPEDFRQGERVRVRTVRSGDNVIDTVCSSVATTHHIHELEWLYIPFHFREQTRRNILKKSLMENLGICDPEELLDLLKSNPSYLTEIKKAYSKIPDGFNTNSMTLFSGTRAMRIAKFLTYPEHLCTRCLFPINPGVLYMGDYDASGRQKWQQLQHAYEDYAPYIGCLQVPHHGSKYNFNIRLLDNISCQACVISAGLINRYGHPDGDVVKQIMLSGKYLGIVTEQSWSEIAMYVSL